MLDVAIIGGGLAGLSWAQRLQHEQYAFAVFEARERFGGRILSLPVPDNIQPVAEAFKSDFGPSWIWPDAQPHIAAFVAEHGGYLEGALASAERVAKALSISDLSHFKRRKIS